MNVIVKFDGREAIPVRAIPFLTDWTHMTPDHVVAALSWEQSFHWHFFGLVAMTVENGFIRPIPNTWWQNFPRQTLKAISDRIAHTQISIETGYQDWRSQSLLAVPPGTFVWKDEYELLYYRYVAPRSAVSHEDGDELRPRYIKLQFDPFIPDPEMQQLVMMGFGQPSELAALPLAVSNADDSCQVADEPTDKIQEDTQLNFNLLATRAQLLKAFGAWGLKEAWFRELASHSWLKAAYRFKGRGQRGQVVEPLFCPLAVMNGLATSIRKKQRISLEKGWGILDHQFPEVSRANSVADPREPTG